MKFQFLDIQKHDSSLSKSSTSKKNRGFSKRSRNLIASFLVIVAGCSLEILPSNHQAAIATSANSSSPLGTNLSGVSYYSSELPFIDGFKSASGWITQTDTVWDTKDESKLDLDQNGWVKSLPAPGSGVSYTKVSTLMYRNLQNLYPSGDYVVLYNGTGTITYGFDATLKSHSPGRDVISVDSSKGGGILLTVTSTDPSHTGDYIRNINVVYQDMNLLFKLLHLILLL